MNFSYPYIIKPQEGGGFFVQFVDFDEAFTEGDTLEEAAFNATEVLTGILGYRLEKGESIPKPSPAKKYQLAAVPLATPLITGPGVITTVIILVNQFGYLTTLIASLLNLMVAWIVLRQTELLFRIFGRQGCDVIARIFGLILVALAVEFIKQGWAAL